MKSNNKTETQPINWKEAQTILKVLKFDFVEQTTKSKDDYRDLLLFTIGFYCGLRISDILNLTWQQLKQDQLELVEKKTKKTRKIQVNKEVRKIINTVLDRVGHNQTGFVFTAIKRYTGQPMTTRGANDRIKAVFEKTGIIVKNPSSHTLRKTFGRRVYEANGQCEDSLVLLSQIFNHRDIKTTRRYIGLTEERILNAYLSI